MAFVLSTINLKGGVGKTTLTVALAETFAAEHDKRVLVIDLDPQTNATVMLIGERRWRELNDKGLTLASLFRDALEPEQQTFDLQRTLQHGVSNVRAARHVDLLPSSLDLIDVQDQLVNTPVGKYGAVRPFDILWRALREVASDYDLVLIDCPPNLGKITQNGLRLSQAFIIPTIPDILSTYGIPQIVRRVRDFSEAIATPIPPLGIVVMKHDGRSKVHETMLEQLRQNHAREPERWPAVFQTIVPQSNQIAGAAEESEYGTLKQKWGYGGLHDRISDVARELLVAIEVNA
jgi:chromosome partitioning protein